MNPKFSSHLRKASFLLGAVLLGWAANAQTTTPSDTTHRQGMHHRWGARNGGDSTMAAKGFHRGGDMAWNRRGRGFDRGSRWAALIAAAADRGAPVAVAGAAKPEFTILPSNGNR